MCKIINWCFCYFDNSLDKFIFMWKNDSKLRIYASYRKEIKIILYHFFAIFTDIYVLHVNVIIN